MRENGQFVSFDLAVAVMVFVFMLFFLFQTWTQNMNAWETMRQRVELEERSQAISKILVESPGYPTNWTVSDVNIIGLAIHPGVLDPQKIASFASMDYNLARSKLNILAFDFTVSLQNENGSNPGIDRNFGANPLQASSISTVERRVRIGDDYAVFRFQLFR